MREIFDEGQVCRDLTPYVPQELVTDEHNRSLLLLLFKHFRRLEARLLMRGAISQTALSILEKEVCAASAEVDELLADPTLPRGQLAGRIERLGKRAKRMAAVMRFGMSRLRPEVDPFVEPPHPHVIEERAKALKGKDLHELDRIAVEAGHVSHDINNIITVVTSYLQLLIFSKDLPEAKVTDYLTRVRSALERVINHTGEHLKGATRMQTLERLPGVFKEMQGSLGNQIAVELDLDPLLSGERPLNISESQIQRLLFDLLDNAAKAGAKNAAAVVRVTGAGVEIHLKDKGPGFKGVDPLAASKFSRRKSASNGNGLPICFKICEVAGGSLALVDKDDPTGAEWNIKLPFLQKVDLSKSKKGR